MTKGHVLAVVLAAACGVLIMLSAVAGASQPVWMGLDVRPEIHRSKWPRMGRYRQDEAAIIDRLPWRNMRGADLNGRWFKTPYTCSLFYRRGPGYGSGETQIEHVVSRAEAVRSGLAFADAQRFIDDPANQTVARPDVNRRKSDRDAAGWRPPHNRDWFAWTIIRVKRKYGLSIDSAERDALAAIIGGAQSDRRPHPHCQPEGAA